MVKADAQLREWFWANVTPGGPDACWLWGGATRDGYGRISRDRKHLPAHRVAYELLVGPIPADLVVDHTCHNGVPSCPGKENCLHRRCVNPRHLEAVPPLVNIERGGALARRTAALRAITVCPRGHLYDEANTYWTPSGSRQCRACRNLWHRRMRQQRKSVGGR